MGNHAVKIVLMLSPGVLAIMAGALFIALGLTGR
jgi:hypothetical protein